MLNFYGLTIRLALLFITTVITPALLFSANDPSNQLLLTVVDGESQERLYGVNVYTDDYETFTGSTDLNGQIKLDNVGHLDKINFSYIGYATVKFPVFELRKAGGVVKLYPAKDLQIDTLVVIGRRDDREEEIPYQTVRIDAKAIDFSHAQTAAEILEKEGGAYIQKSQMGGGSPILRGFEANRVLLVLDGVRMNNAIYRSGHLQNAITVDNSILEQAEVIYGPGSLIYGSDALGGVVHYRTRDPKLVFGDGKDYRLETNYSARFASANQEKRVHLDIDYGSRSWGSLTSFSIADYSHLRAGDNRPDAYPELGLRRFYAFRNENADEVRENPDPNVQIQTGYTQIDFLQKIRFQPSDKLYFIGNFQYSTSTNIPRYDSLADTLSSADELKYSEWHYGPQKRLLASLKARMLNSTFLYDKGTIIGSFQKIDEDRLTRKFASSHRDWNSEDVFVYSLTIDFDKQLDKQGQHVIAYGADANYNYVNSRAVQQSARTGAISVGPLSRYASAGNEMMTQAGYMNYTWGNKKKTFFFNVGGRYTDVSVKGKYDIADQKEIPWPESYFDGIENRKQDISYAGGITWNSTGGWQVRMLGSRAFRVPNVDDLFKIRKKNSKVVLPNTDLRPEVAQTGEITLGKTFGKPGENYLKISGTGFYTQLTDIIVRKNGKTPDGSDTLLAPDGEILEVQQNFNASEGTIFGWSGNIHLHLNRRWEVKGSLNHQEGTALFTVENELGNIIFDTLSPMDHLPPMYGKASLGFTGDRFKLEGVLRFNFAKPAEDYAITAITLDSRSGEVLEIERDGSDNFLYSGTCREEVINGITTTVCDGSPAWLTYNLYSSFQLSPKFSLNFAIENLADLHYRTASSGLSSAGRNFILGFKGKF